MKESATKWQSQEHLNDPVVSCIRTRLAMLQESTPQLRLPKLEDAFRT